MGYGLQGAYGLDAAQQGLRQRLMDQMLQRKQEQDMAIQLREQALREQEAQQRAEAFKQSTADRAAALAERTQTANVGEATRIAPQLPMDQNVAPEAAGILQAGGLGGQLYTPPTMGENVSGKPYDPGTANPSMNLGTAPQQATATKQRILGRMIGGLEPGSRERMALEYTQATGENAPAGMFDKTVTPRAPVQVGPKGIFTDPQEALGQEAYHPPKDTSYRDQARLDKSNDTQTKRLDAMEKPLADQAERIGRLRATFNQMTPQADALIAPELLTAMAGGQGSGLRMNEAEISRIVGGRTKWESLKSSLLAWQLDPTKPFSVTDEQRKQMRDLVKAVADRGRQRLKMLDEARDRLVDSQDVQEHRRIVNETSRRLNADALGDEQPSTDETPEQRRIRIRKAAGL